VGPARRQPAGAYYGTDNWEWETIDMVQPGLIEFGEDDLGGPGFIVVTGESCRWLNAVTPYPSGLASRGQMTSPG
jgi:hypothetical protein